MTMGYNSLVGDMGTNLSVDKIQHLPMTRVMIAHRQETINMAEQVYHLDNGALQNLTEVCSQTAS